MAARREHITVRGAEFQAPRAEGELRAEHDARFEREALPWLASVYRYALSLCRHPEDAEDIVQETYLRAFRSWHSFDPESDCRRWLFAICRNVFLRSLERARPQLRLDGASALATLEATVARDPLRPDELELIIARLDLVPALRAALDQLPEPYRSAVILVDVEDQSYEAAAQIMRVPVGTVRSRLFRGRRLLQRMLVEHAADRGYATSEGSGTRDQWTASPSGSSS